MESIYVFTFMISIVTGTHNNIKTLPYLYESLLTQDDKDFEWIVCDDGSDDGTWQYIQEIDKEKKLNMEAYSQINKGMRLSRSLNNGLRRAKGNIVLVVFGDSFVNQDCIFNLNADFQYGTAGCGLRRNIDQEKQFVSWDWRIGNNEDMVNKIMPLDVPKPWQTLCGNGMIVERDLLKHIGYWPEEYEGYGREDWSVYLRLSRCNVPMVMYNTIIINHFSHTEGKDSPDNIKRFEKELYETNMP